MELSWYDQHSEVTRWHGKNAVSLAGAITYTTGEGDRNTLIARSVEPFSGACPGCDLRKFDGSIQRTSDDQNAPMAVMSVQAA